MDIKTIIFNNTKIKLTKEQIALNFSLYKVSLVSDQSSFDRVFPAFEAANNYFEQLSIEFYQTKE